jgi:hypothetical protein
MIDQPSCLFEATGALPARQTACQPAHLPRQRPTCWQPPAPLSCPDTASPCVAARSFVMHEPWRLRVSSASCTTKFDDTSCGTTPLSNEWRPSHPTAARLPMFIQRHYQTCLPYSSVDVLFHNRHYSFIYKGENPIIQEHAFQAAPNQPSRQK